MTKPIRLKDLIPVEAEIELYCDDEKKTYVLRKFDLADSQWLSVKFGGEKNVELLFSNLEMDKICIIVFRLLKDKSDFKAIDISDYDDDGYEIKRKLLGPERVLKAIAGQVHKINVVQGLLKTIGFSQPIMDEAQEEEIKKKEIELNQAITKARAQKTKRKLIGERSSTN